MQVEGLTVEAIQQQLQQQQILCAQLVGQLALVQMQSTSLLLEPTKSISQKQILEVDQSASYVASKRTISESSQDSSFTSTGNQKKSKTQHYGAELSTPERTISECSTTSATSERTISEYSTSSATSGTGPANAGNEKKKNNPPKKTKYQKTSPRVNLVCERLSVDQFATRLSDRLSKDVMEKQLRRTFPRLYAFRKCYIIPLSNQICSSNTSIELKDIDRTGFKMDEFLKDYKSLFVEGCNVLRRIRGKDQEVIPDKEARAAYRNYISDCWFILGKYK